MTIDAKPEQLVKPNPEIALEVQQELSQPTPEFVVAQELQPNFASDPDSLPLSCTFQVAT